MLGHLGAYQAPLTRFQRYPQVTKCTLVVPHDFVYGPEAVAATKGGSVAVTELSRGSGVSADEPVAPRQPWLGRLSAGHVLMVVAAIVAGLFNLVALRSGDERVPVAVVAAPVAAGQPVTAAALRYEPLGIGQSLQASLVTQAAAAATDDWVAVRDLQAGDVLRRSDLRTSAAPDGQRAMSIPVEPAHAAGGALRAGDRVDVIDVGEQRAAYVITDAEVLAVTGGGTGGLGGIGGFSITVAVDADAALRLAVAIRSESVDVVRSTGAAPASAAPLGTGN